ncbi:MAG: hypothetical protein IT257_01245 [Chitinophagaceae bacterium]|nr:hypothetical protein [Chitinophagaceae bacterium]
MKALVIIFLFSGSMIGSAQDPKFKGIGELKVGETSVSLIEEVAAKSKRKIKQLHSYSSADDANFNKFIVEYVKPLNKCSDAVNPLLPEHRVFVIYNYAIMDQYPSPKIILEFYNEVLYHFVVSEPQFVEAFKTKYGQPSTDEILHSSNCEKDALSVAPNEKDIVESWDDNGIHAAYILAESRSAADCEKVVKTKFEVTDMEKNKTVQVLEHNALKACQEAEVADKKMIVPSNF